MSKDDTNYYLFKYNFKNNTNYKYKITKLIFNKYKQFGLLLYDKDKDLFEILFPNLEVVYIKLEDNGIKILKRITKDNKETIHYGFWGNNENYKNGSKFMLLLERYKHFNYYLTHEGYEDYKKGLISEKDKNKYLIFYEINLDTGEKEGVYRIKIKYSSFVDYIKFYKDKLLIDWDLYKKVNHKYIFEKDLSNTVLKLLTNEIENYSRSYEMLKWIESFKKLYGIKNNTFGNIENIKKMKKILSNKEYIKTLDKKYIETLNFNKKDIFENYKYGYGGLLYLDLEKGIVKGLVNYLDATYYHSGASPQLEIVGKISNKEIVLLYNNRGGFVAIDSNDKEILKMGDFGYYLIWLKVKDKVFK